MCKLVIDNIPDSNIAINNRKVLILSNKEGSEGSRDESSLSMFTNVGLKITPDYSRSHFTGDTGKWCCWSSVIEGWGCWASGGRLSGASGGCLCCLSGGGCLCGLCRRGRLSWSWWLSWWLSWLRPCRKQTGVHLI